MPKTLRIGTRASQLAIWQAEKVAKELQAKGFQTEIVPITSEGDLNLEQPLYAMGITGVFTKALDVALLNQQIDMAVHSLKDIPTILPKNILISAVLERDFPEDILILNQNKTSIPKEKITLATDSLRRRAFWKHQFPNATFQNIRGNVQTRLKKLEEQNLDATLLSRAAVERMKISVKYEILDFMIPAPSQGVIACTSLQSDDALNAVLDEINHTDTAICTTIERDFLNAMEGGCSMPIGAFAEKKGADIHFRAAIGHPDGSAFYELNQSAQTPVKEQGKIWAEEFKRNSAVGELLRDLKK